jgi:hypothetical protein
MIPNNLIASRGFVMRKVGGFLHACRLLVTSTGQRIKTYRPSLAGTAGYFLQAVFPVLLFLLLTAGLLGVLHLGVAAAGGISHASTTGTGTGTDFNGLNSMLKERYTKAFENNVEKDEEVADLITKAEGFEVVEGEDGKKINIGHIFSSGGGVMSMLEDDYLPNPTNPTTQQSSITIKQHVAMVQLSGRALRRVKKGPAAFVTWATEALPRKAQRLAFHKDRQRLGTGTGIIARYNDASVTGTADGLDSMFGISGLDDRATMLLLRDDNIRVGPNADGTSLRTGTALVGAVTYATKSINTTVGGSAAAPTSAADNDYIFLGDANVNGSGAREMMGLEGIIDDGTNLTAFQGLTRATYPELNAQIVDASTGGWDGTLSEEILDYADSLCFERGNMGRPKNILVNRSGQRSFWKNLKNDRVINDPAGTYKGGKIRLKMMLGDRIVDVSAGRKVPASRCYGIDGTGIQRYKIGNGRWDDTTGSIWDRYSDSTGKKDAFFAVYVEEEEMGAGNPAGSFKITNLTEA